MLYLGILNPNHQNVVYASTNLANIKKHEAAVHDKKKSFQCRHCPHSAFARDKIVIRIKLLNVINVNTPHPTVITSKTYSDYSQPRTIFQMH